MSKSSFLTTFAIGLAMLTLSSCFKRESPVAPKSIKGYIIGMYNETVSKGDEKYLHKTEYLEFRHDGKYIGYLDGQKSDFGDYAYHRTSNMTASLIMTYANEEVNFAPRNFVTLMKFIDPTHGTWETTYEHDDYDPESGTFKIIRHGY